MDEERERRIEDAWPEAPEGGPDEVLADAPAEGSELVSAEAPGEAAEPVSAEAPAEGSEPATAEDRSEGSEPATAEDPTEGSEPVTADAPPETGDLLIDETAAAAEGTNALNAEELSSAAPEVSAAPALPRRRRLRVPGLVRTAAAYLVVALLGGVAGGLLVGRMTPKVQAPAAGLPLSILSTTGEGDGTLLPTAGGETIAVTAEEANTITVVDAALPSVVQIRVQGVTSGYSVAIPTQGVGSGFVYDYQGHIVTNNHVVEGNTSIEVIFPDGSSQTAKVVGTDRLSDLAVIKVDRLPAGVAPLPLADSAKVRVGQKAIAIGYPLSGEDTSSMGLNRNPSVTQGIISATDRVMPVMNERNSRVKDFEIEGLVQTDAAINPGNSGGPLLNSRGEVVGVNTAIIAGAEGIGFAVPASTVQVVVPELIDSGSVERPFLGITFVDLSLSGEVLGEVPQVPGKQGVLVIEVQAGSPSDKAGLRGTARRQTNLGYVVTSPGDVVTAINGNAVNGTTLAGEILKYKAGDKVRLSVYRDGQTLSLEVTLTTRE